MVWKAVVSDDPASFNTDVRIADVYQDEVVVAAEVVEGHVTMRRQQPAEEVPRLLSLPIEALEALRDALNQHSPPTDDRDLRDALAVERARVDRILDRQVLA